MPFSKKYFWSWFFHLACHLIFRGVLYFVTFNHLCHFIFFFRNHVFMRFLYFVTFYILWPFIFCDISPLLESCFYFSSFVTSYVILNKPGVARAVLQTASWLSDSLVHSFILFLLLTLNPKPLMVESWQFERMFTSHHVSYVNLESSKRKGVYTSPLCL